jgi:serine/threonine protein kinase
MLVTGFPDDDDNLFGGRYRIISRLGAGAYRAWDEQEGRLVVIKIVKKAFLDDPKFTERFARKIRLLQGLRHPHIVPIVDVDVGEHDGLPFVVIVMRFLPGGSLSNHRLRDDNGKVRPNPPGMLHLWLPDVADALDHVHANGVVHRDVKPANIFFDAYRNAFLGDFGNAKIVEESERFAREKAPAEPQMCIGAPPYMSPEQFTPKPVLDGRTDQYALAVTVYEMVSGTRPFTGTTAHLIVEVTTQPVPRLDQKRAGLPASLVEAVHRGLSKDPRERFNTCREFSAAVLRDVPLLHDEPDTARLLCPQCSNILKLSKSAAGQKGRCPRCQTPIKVAEDLGALWLLDEARRQRHSTASGPDFEVGPDPVETGQEIDEEALDAFKPVSSTTPIGRAARARSGMTIGGLCLFLGLWSITPMTGVLIYSDLMLLVNRTSENHGILGSAVDLLCVLLLVGFPCCCAAALATLYFWELVKASKPTHIFRRNPKLSLLASVGVIGLAGGSPLFVPFLIQIYRGPSQPVFSVFPAVWAGLIGLGFIWLWASGWPRSLLGAYLGNPNKHSRALLSLTIAVVGLYVAWGTAVSGLPMRHVPDLPTVIVSPPPRETIQAQRRRYSHEVIFDDRSELEGIPGDAGFAGEGEWLTDTAPARYRYFAKPATWADAHAACQRMKGHLLVIETAKELAFICDAFGPDPSRERPSVWTGGRYNEARRQWTWIDTRNQVLWWATNQPIDFTELMIAAPVASKAGNRLAVLLDETMRLAPVREETKLPFICEW